MQQLDPFEWNAETICQDLRKGRCVALAVIQGAGDDGDGTVGLEADAAHLIACVRGYFQIVADAAPPYLAARTALGLTRGVAVPISGDQRLFHDGGEFAAIIHHAGWRSIWHLLRLDVVTPPQFHTVDAHLARRGLNQALHVVVAFRPSRATIGANRCCVGEYALRRYLDERRGIDADDVLHRVHRRRDRGGIAKPGTEIAVARDAQREEFALGIQCEFRGHLVVAAMAIGQEAFGPLVCPLHRTA